MELKRPDIEACLGSSGAMRHSATQSTRGPPPAHSCVTMARKTPLMDFLSAIIRQSVRKCLAHVLQIFSVNLYQSATQFPGKW